VTGKFTHDGDSNASALLAFCCLAFAFGCVLQRRRRRRARDLKMLALVVSSLIQLERARLRAETPDQI
jgi:hypothetical protein